MRFAVRTVHEEIKKQADLIDDYAAASKGAAKVTKRDILNMLEFSVNRASQRVHSEAARRTRRSAAWAPRWCACS